MLQIRRNLVPAAFSFAALFLFLMVSLPRPAGAQAIDPFSVRNVQVDISAETVAVARDRALAEGQRQALDILLQRLTSSADWSRLPKLAGKELDYAVLDVGIDQEKRSTVRYIATLSVRFKPDAIRKLLRGANIAYAEWRGRPVAVLPVFQAESGPVLGETPNPWRDAWKSGAAQGIVPLVVPTNEQLDGVISAAQAAAGGDSLTTVGQRFNTQDVLMVLAQQQRLDGGKVKLEVTLAGIGPVAGPLAGNRSYDGETGETVDQLLRRAVEDIAKAANDGWKSGNLLQYDRQASLSVIVPLSGLDDWLAVRDHLTRSTPVRGYEIAALSKNEASLVLHFVGEQSQLEQVFMQNGLVLSWISDHWILQTASSRPSGVSR